MKNAERDFCEILGISRDADSRAIERAFHALAMKYHPTSMEPFILTSCLVAAVAMVVLSLAAIQTSRRIVDSWIRVEDARILECKIKPRGIWTWPVVVYEYDAGDLRHIGEDMPPIPTLGIRAAQFRQRYPPGCLLVVYVNPENHQMSTIAPYRLSRLGVFGIAAASVCLMLAGLAGFSGA